MLRLSALALAMLAAGCSMGTGTGGAEPAGAAAAPQGPAEAHAHLRDASCYTVDLYDPVPVEEPGPEVPAEYAQFLGSWENGAWDGEWCHDLLIFRVEANGRVHLLDMHAPYEKYGLSPTVFQRTARIHDDGTLRFAYGTETRRYRLERNILVGERRGGYGRMEVALVDPERVPMPRPRPVRAARR